MRNILLFSMVTLFILTGCSGVAVSNPTQTSQAIETSESTQAPVQEEANHAERLFEIKLTEDSMKDPYGVAINSLGHIYVSDMGNSRILIFDAMGNLIDKWDLQGSGDGAFQSMGFGGLVIDQNDNVFVVDNGNYRIQKFDKDGKYLLQWGTEGIEASQFSRAIGIAVDVSGNVYVTDDGNPYVQKFDNEGNFLMRFGGPGDGGGTFKHATGIAVDRNGNIFVADYETKGVQKFDADGIFISEWKMGEDIHVTGTPEGLVVDEQGKVYVTDYNLGRLQVFDNEGQFLWAISGEKITEKLFKRPTSVALDGRGKLYIVNQATAAVTVFQLP